MINVTAATQALEKRGPDFQDVYTDAFVGLGHRRLSIIDTSAAANQPMWDEERRYCIIFNGEIFNYRELRQELTAKGVSFTTQSDTEVLLKCFIREKERCLCKLNGFFSFCIYDKQEQSFFLARDRYGVKPLLYLFDEDKFLFASEMKSILAYGIEKDLDFTALQTYLQLNYIPAPNTIIKGVKKVMPGHCLTVHNKHVTVQSYYKIPYEREKVRAATFDYESSQQTFSMLLEKAVQRRLVSDVPLGAFLSGGVDSSVVSVLAKRHKPDLHTFSIGFRDEKFFDETHYARLVAAHIQTEHTVFSLTNQDLYEHLHAILNYIDEPFADSSAINVYILSKETRKHATVALSGDGADELLGGYNKHAAFLGGFHPGWKENMILRLDWMWKHLPQSRNNFLTNRSRQIAKLSQGLKLPIEKRYWHWAALATQAQANSLLLPEHHAQILSNKSFDALADRFSGDCGINEILLTDMEFVLPNDMLAKVDLMSMANSLEVRTPFLDFELVNFSFTLPEAFKINTQIRKRILQDTFRPILPEALYNRPKKGFEVPLLKWFRTEMKSIILDDLLSKKFIEDQHIFNYPEIENLKRKLFSANPGDVHANIWGLIVFQWWWRKYFSK